MRYHFYSYIYPTWYFHLELKNGPTYFVDTTSIKTNENILPENDSFSSVEARKWDDSFIALQRGLVLPKASNQIPENISLKDEYSFVRKYFNPIWGYYILLLRLLSFHNPIKEVRAFYLSRKVKRVDLFGSHIDHRASMKGREYSLLKEMPSVSVVIPTLNRYKYLKDVLHDLENQDYKNFEVIIVDQSDPYNADFYSDFNLNIKLIYQEEKALWLARNFAIEQANSDYILLFDDDSRVESNWISSHLRCLEHFDADISSGVSISKVGDKVPKNYSFYRWSDQLDTGNVMVKRRVFEEIGLFDRNFEKQRMGDSEFGLRAYLNGFKNISNPDAQRLHLKVDQGGLRQMGSWDAYRPKKIWKPRPIPSVLYLFRKYYGKRLTVLALIKNIPLSMMPYRFKGNKLLSLLSVLFAFVFAPLVLIQVLRSWNESSRMLESGPRIKSLSAK